MGRKLDALLGRNFRTSKFKTLVKLAVSRIAILKNQHQVRCSVARSDVIELLHLGHQDRALLRVELVIKEQNMLDAFVMIENYCHLLIERVLLIQKNKECPDELQEAISSLIFASSRSGEFPELQEIRGNLTSKFGKDMAARAVDLRNNCGVNPKIIQKFSSRHPSLENKMKMLKEIASANNIALHFEGDAPAKTEEKLDIEKKQKQNQAEPDKPRNLDNQDTSNDKHELPQEFNIDEKLSESIKGRKRYKDVAAAAQEAFKSAAYAAAAARAAFELSRSESQENDPDDQSDSNDHEKTNNSKESLTPEISGGGCESSEGSKHSDEILEFAKIHPIDNFSLGTEDSDMAEKINQIDQEELQNDKEKEIQRMSSANSSDSHKGTLIDKDMSSESDLVSLQDDKDKGIERTLSANSLDSLTDFLNDGKLSSDKSCQNDQSSNEILVNRVDDLDSELKPSLPTTEFQTVTENETVEEEKLLKEDENSLPNRSSMQIPLNSEADTTTNPMEGTSTLTSTQRLTSENHPQSDHSAIDKKWISMRAREHQT